MSMDLTADSKASILTAALCSRHADRNFKAYLMTAIGRAPQMVAGLAGRRRAPAPSDTAGQSSPAGRSQSRRMLP
jgi:hypothetical protein